MSSLQSSEAWPISNYFRNYLRKLFKKSILTVWQKFFCARVVDLCNNIVPPKLMDDRTVSVDNVKMDARKIGLLRLIIPWFIGCV